MTVGSGRGKECNVTIKVKKVTPFNRDENFKQESVSKKVNNIGLKRASKQPMEIPFFNIGSDPKNNSTEDLLANVEAKTILP